MVTKIGNYELGQSADDLSLQKVDAGTGWRAAVRDVEKAANLYKAPDTHFLNFDWDVEISIHENKINRIWALKSWTIWDLRGVLEKHNALLAWELLFKNVLRHITDEMGKYDAHAIFSMDYFWRRTEGSVKLRKDKVRNPMGLVGPELSGTLLGIDIFLEANIPGNFRLLS